MGTVGDGAGTAGGRAALVAAVGAGAPAVAKAAAGTPATVLWGVGAPSAAGAGALAPPALSGTVASSGTAGATGTCDDCAGACTAAVPALGAGRFGSASLPIAAVASLLTDEAGPWVPADAAGAGPGLGAPVAVPGAACEPAPPVAPAGGWAAAGAAVADLASASLLWTAAEASAAWGAAVPVGELLAPAGEALRVTGCGAWEHPVATLSESRTSNGRIGASAARESIGTARAAGCDSERTGESGEGCCAGEAGGASASLLAARNRGIID